MHAKNDDRRRGAAARAEACAMYGVVALILVAHALLGGIGCAAPKSVFRFEDHSVNAQPRVYVTEFDESFFDMDRAGNLMLVLRRTDEPPEQRGWPTEQVLVLRSVWEPVPGRTFAERTQINATATYAILSGRSGATYEGAGSIFFHRAGDGETMSGTVEHVVLKPRRKRTPDSVLFDHVVLSGQFHARRDRRETIRAANELHRVFGPLPPPMGTEGE